MNIIQLHETDLDGASLAATILLQNEEGQELTLATDATPEAALAEAQETLVRLAGQLAAHRQELANEAAAWNLLDRAQAPRDLLEP